MSRFFICYRNNELAPNLIGNLDQIIIPGDNPGENFGVCYDGYIKIPTDGSYTFYVNSDDGSDLFIDDELVVDNDGLHAPQEESGIIFLKAGFHKINVRFFQAGGRQALEIGIEGPNMKKQGIPKEMLFH